MIATDGTFVPDHWFWTINGDQSQFWSSAAAAFVSSLPDGATVSDIASAIALTRLLRGYGLPGPLAALPEDTRQASFVGDNARAQVLGLLQTSTPAAIRTFVATNVTDLASARTMLANILVLIALDPRN